MTERRSFLTNPFAARAARWGLVAWSVIGVLILAVVVYRYVLYPIRIVFAPLVVALIVLNLLDPLVSRLERRGLRRWLATLIVYVVFLAGAGVGLAYVAPVITHQVREFVAGFPGLLDRAQRTVQDVSARLGIQLSSSQLVGAFQPSQGETFQFLGRLTSFTSGVVHAVFVLVLGPLLAFYLLADLPKILRNARSLVPGRRREEFAEVSGRVGDAVGTFVRGQLVAAFLLGVASMLGLWIVGFPYFALFGAVVGLLALVPLIGIVIAAVPTLFVALTVGPSTGGLLHVPGGWRLALACAVVLVLVQELDTRVLVRLRARPARLHPITVLLSLLIGGTLLGLWGMLLAVPVVAAGKVIVLHVWDTRSQWPPRVTPVPSGLGEAAEGAVGGGAVGDGTAGAPEEVVPRRRALGRRG